MYEEEDDLPSQYRNVSSHLYGGGYPMGNGGPGFNQRMIDFLATNMHMRNMVGSYMQAAESQNNPSAMAMQTPMQTPMSIHIPPPPQYMGPPQQAHPAAHSGGMYRQAPYPTPRPPPQPSFHGHQRSASFAVPAGQPAAVQLSPVAQATDHRRASMPAVIPVTDGSPSQMSTPHSAHSAQSTPPQMPTTISSRQSSNYGYQTQASQPQQQQQTVSAYDTNTFPADYFPFTAQLPANAQGLLGSTLDTTDPINRMMMAGSGNLPGSYFDFGSQQQAPSNVNPVGQQTHPTLHGLGSTLAPSAFDIPAGADQSQVPSFFNEAFNTGNSGNATPAVTPGDNVQWGQFMSNDWDDLQSSQ